MSDATNRRERRRFQRPRDAAVPPRRSLLLLCLSFLLYSTIAFHVARGTRINPTHRLLAIEMTRNDGNEEEYYSLGLRPARRHRPPATVSFLETPGPDRNRTTAIPPGNCSATTGNDTHGSRHDAYRHNIHRSARGENTPAAVQSPPQTGDRAPLRSLSPIQDSQNHSHERTWAHLLLANDSRSGEEVPREATPSAGTGQWWAREPPHSILSAFGLSRFFPDSAKEGSQRTEAPTATESTAPTRTHVPTSRVQAPVAGTARTWPDLRHRGIQSPPTVAASVHQVLHHKRPTDLLTVQDLESILVTNRFVRERDLEAWTHRVLHNVSRSTPQSSSILPPENRSMMGHMGQAPHGGPTSVPRKSLSSNISPRTSTASSTVSSSVAFPQPSVLSYADWRLGTIIAASFCGLLLGASIMANLWLMGCLLGALYANDLTRSLESTASEPQSLVPRLLLDLGRWLAKSWLRVYDSVTILWFLYKTGQLSYEYFKRYEALDQRFAIQEKIDAWNARFVQGKLAFDEWERQNEVGRKIMATLRTVWLVEEQSMKKLRQRRSKYRVVELAYDGLSAVRRLLRSIWLILTGRMSKELSEFLEGLRVRMTETRVAELGSRLGASLTALFLLNILGAVFTLSPTSLSILALLLGFAWPSWWSEFADRLVTFADETRSLGRREVIPLTRPLSSSKPLSLFPPRLDKDRYGYYVRPDGTKRYYLKGQPWFRPREEPQPKRLWPWQTKPDERKDSWSWPSL